MDNQDKNKFPSIAIVGSGPSGCYVAQFLNKKWPASNIVIFEALPTPYGLIRYGIASDHQGGKAITQQFDRLFESGGVEFFGNIKIGKDITLNELNEIFDIVILAIGVNSDRTLKIISGSNCNVVGAGSLLKALNSHPVEYSKIIDAHNFNKIGKDVVIIGCGNVALDVVRLIVKTKEDLVGSDVNHDIRDILGVGDVKKITLISRSGTAEAKCDLSMLEELNKLENVKLQCKDMHQFESDPVADFFKIAATKNISSNREKIVEFNFNKKPVRVKDFDSRTVVFSECTKTGEISNVAADTVISAIGFESDAEDLTILGNAKKMNGVYFVGWCRSGPIGTVPQNRKDAKAVAEQIIYDYENGYSNVLNKYCNKNELMEKLEGLNKIRVNFKQWKKIDRYEQESSSEFQC